MVDSSALRLLVWQAGALRCGAPIERLARVLPALPATRIPGVPDVVRGVINVRGDPVTVVDCRTLLGQPDEHPGAEVILVRNGPRLVGLEVDQVHDIITVPDGALRPVESGAGWEADVGDGPAVRLLDLDALLDPLFEAGGSGSA